MGSHMLQAIPTAPATKSNNAPVIPAAVLDNLAARFRPSGLCLLMLDRDGALAYHDESAGLFFQRFAIPMIQYPDPVAKLAERVAAMNVNSAVEVWNALPGVVLAAFPYVEKRQLTGVLLLAAKGSSFRLGEDVLRVC